MVYQGATGLYHCLINVVPFISNSVVLLLLLLLLFWWSPFSPSRNLDYLYTYNTMDIMSLRSRSYAKASMVLTRADHLFINNYIRSLLNNILRHMLMVRRGSNPRPTACVSGALAI